MPSIETTESALKYAKKAPKEVAAFKLRAERQWSKTLLKRCVEDFEQNPSAQNYQKLQNAMLHYQIWHKNVKARQQ